MTQPNQNTTKNPYALLNAEDQAVVDAVILIKLKQYVRDHPDSRAGRALAFTLNAAHQGRMSTSPEYEAMTALAEQIIETTRDAYAADTNMIAALRASSPEERSANAETKTTLDKMIAIDGDQFPLPAPTTPKPKSHQNGGYAIV